VIVDREAAVGCDVPAFGNWVGASGHRILRVALGKRIAIVRDSKPRCIVRTD
jgi:hypothetical protein